MEEVDHAGQAPVGLLDEGVVELVSAGGFLGRPLSGEFCELFPGRDDNRIFGCLMGAMSCCNVRWLLTAMVVSAKSFSVTTELLMWSNLTHMPVVTSSARWSSRCACRVSEAFATSDSNWKPTFAQAFASAELLMLREFSERPSPMPRTLA